MELLPAVTRPSSNNSLLHGQRSHHVALRQHRPHPAGCTGAAGIEAAEGIDASFSSLEGESDTGVASSLGCIAGDGNVEAQLRDGKGMSDFIESQSSIHVAVGSSNVPNSALHLAIGRASRERGITQIVVLQRDGHHAIGWHYQMGMRIARPVLLHARLINQYTQVQAHMF